ncbi:MAG: sigma-70 family RNA polymerase sigma factor [Pseudomonadota bacterium]
MSKVDPEELARLIATVSLGDRRAFSDLYDLASPQVFGVAMRMMKDRAAAEDVLQEAFMKIWRHAGQFSAGGMHPMSWMLTIARNTAIDKLRRVRQAEDLADWDDRLSDNGPTPEQAVLANAERERIFLCMGELKSERAKAVQWAYLDGFSYAELAEKLDVPLNTVRTWLRRSLISLQECMAR